MTARPLSEKEKAAYRAGGFRLDGPPRSEARARRHRLGAARRLLHMWGADAKTVRTALAVASARSLSRQLSGQCPIPQNTLERVEIVLALYRRLLKPGDIVDIEPLPALRRAGRKSLPARDVLARGRLSDLLSLWRQLALVEERADRRPTERRRTR